MIINNALFLITTTNLFESQGRIPCSRPVTYSILNRCNWSSMTHPTDYPAAAHFSNLCGAAHNPR